MESNLGVPRGSKGTEPLEFTAADGWLTRTSLISRTIYWGIHASCLLVFWVGATKTAKAEKLGVEVVDQGEVWRLLIDAGVA